MGRVILVKSPTYAGDATDPYWTSTVLLIEFEGADNATSTSDTSFAGPQNVAMLNGASLQDSPTPPYGTTSAQFDGSNDYVRVLDSASFTLGTSHFTIEAWIYLNNLTAGDRTIMGQWGGVSNLGYTFAHNAANLYFNTSTTGSNMHFDLGYNGGISATTWHHVAVTYDGTKQRMHIDGVMVNSVTVSRNISNSSQALGVGGNSSGGQLLNGYIKGLRFTVGAARYGDSTFTPPEGYPTA